MFRATFLAEMGRVHGRAGLDAVAQGLQELWALGRLDEPAGLPGLGRRLSAASRDAQWLAAYVDELAFDLKHGEIRSREIERQLRECARRLGTAGQALRRASQALAQLEAGERAARQEPS